VKILVLGAGGQVGVEVAKEAARLGVACDALGRADADLADAARLSAIVRATDADVVVNCGAYTAVDLAESEPDRAFAVNRDGPAALADACAARGLALVHFSTDYVFDGTKERPYVESDPVAPLSVYGRSKDEGERAIRRRHHRHVVLRTSWVYAAHGKNFVRTMLRLGAEKPELRVVDDQRGAPTSAADLAQTALHVAEKLVAGRNERVLPPYGTYHCTAEGETTWCAFAEEIFAAAGARLPRRPRVVPIPTSAYPTPAVRPRRSVLDNARLVAAFAPPRRDWRAGLRDVLDELLGPATPKRTP
jgi:dTDP-4-dehydrorhamnose reductase